jgi:hypothetical protein
VGLFASSLALSCAWYARPRGDLLTTWGGWPAASALAIAMSALAWIEPELAEVLAPAGPATAGAIGLLTGLVHMRQTRLIARLRRYLPDESDRVDVRASGRTRRVRVDDVRRGDEVALSPGDDVPVDAVVINGTGFIDERSLTAAVLPRTVKPGDRVLAGTVSSVPGLVVRASAPAARSVVMRRAKLIAQMGHGCLVMHGGLRWISVFLILAGLVAGVLMATVLGLEAIELWMPSVAGVLLATVTVAPALARAAFRVDILCAARRHGLVLARVKDIDALGRVARWQVDPSLVAAPGNVDVIPLESTGSDELLGVAHALLREERGPESLSVSAQVRQRRVEVPESAALRRTQALFHGTVAHQRWVMGPCAAVEADCGVEVPGRALGHLTEFRAQGAVAWVLAHANRGAVAVLGIEIAADASARDAAQALDASLMPGLLDTTTKALAQAAGVKSHGPPLRAEDGVLVARASARPSEGLCIVVEDAAHDVELRVGVAPRLFSPGLAGFAELVDFAAEGTRRLRRRVALASMTPVLAAMMMAWQGWLLPELGALVAAVAIGIAVPAAPEVEE